MQPKDSTDKSHLSQKQKEQRRGYINDQQNIREIIEKHPYKRWEEIEDNAPDSN